MLTFEIYPTIPGIPAVAEVLKRTGDLFSRQLEMIGIDRVIEMELLREDADGPVPLDVAQPFWVERRGRFRMQAKGLHGQIAVFTRDDAREIALMRDELCASNTIPAWEIEPALGHSREWSFRSSAGRTKLGEFALGCCAAAFATLVDGLLYSDEGHWIDEQMPMRVDDFLSVYFADRKDWYERINAEI